MRSIRICFVGDSMVNGTGDPECLGWTGRVCAHAIRAGHDVTHYNLGIRRDTSADVLARWREEVARRLPMKVDGRVVFSFGLNDTVIEDGRPRIGLDDSLANLRAILREARQSYPVLVVGPPPMAAESAHQMPAWLLSSHYEAACGQLGVPYLDVVADLERTGTFIRVALANDGAHPRAAGYGELAALVTRWDAWQAWFS